MTKRKRRGKRPGWAVVLRCFVFIYGYGASDVMSIITFMVLVIFMVLFMVMLTVSYGAKSFICEHKRVRESKK